MYSCTHKDHYENHFLSTWCAADCWAVVEHEPTFPAVSELVWLSNDGKGIHLLLVETLSFDLWLYHLLSLKAPLPSPQLQQSNTQPELLCNPKPRYHPVLTISIRSMGFPPPRLWQRLMCRYLSDVRHQPRKQNTGKGDWKTLLFFKLFHNP